jgi:hypothetical protein
MNVIPVNSKYLLNKQWSYEMIAQDVFRLDQEECSEYEVDIIRVVKAVSSPLKRFFYLYDSKANKIIGYFDYRALDASSYESVINGVFKDGSLAPVPFKDQINLYIGGFVIQKEYRHDSSNFKKLLVVFVEDLINLLNSEVVIKNISARGLTPLGQKLCEGLGMNKILNHRDKGVIYAISFDWEEKPKYGSILYDVVKKTKAQRLLKELLGIDEKTGLPLIKKALSNWGYNVDGI